MAIGGAHILNLPLAAARGRANRGSPELAAPCCAHTRPNRRLSHLTSPNLPEFARWKILNHVNMWIYNLKSTKFSEIVGVPVAFRPQCGRGAHHICIRNLCNTPLWPCQPLSRPSPFGRRCFPRPHFCGLAGPRPPAHPQPPPATVLRICRAKSSVSPVTRRI